MKRTLTLVVTFAVIIAALVTVANIRKPKAPAPTTQDIWKQSGIPVQVAEVSRGDMAESIDITGDLTALNSAVISPKINGRLTTFSIHEGDVVSKGQVVAMLDQGDALNNLQSAQASLESAKARLAQAETTAEVTKTQTQSAIEQAESTVRSALAKLETAKRPNRSQERLVAENNVNSAKANLDRAEADYKRNERLRNRGAISESTFDGAKAEYLVAQANHKSAIQQLSLIEEGGRREDVTSAQAQVDSARSQLRTAKANASDYKLRLKDIQAAKASLLQAKAAVDTAKRQLDNTYIKSSISGVVSTKTAEVGQVVSPGGSLAEVVDLNSVYFKGEVSENALALISKGQSVAVHIDALAGESLKGVVVEIYPSGSTASRNFSVRISLVGAKDRAKPGMFATGTIGTGIRKNILRVSKDAVSEGNGIESVYRLESDNTVKKITVKVVKSDRNSSRIEETLELKVGDRLVTQGIKNVQDGTKVELEKKEKSDVAN